MEAAWDAVLADWQGATPEEVAEVRTYVAREYDDLQQTLLDVDDATERATLLTHYYIRAKMEWLITNTQIGYQMAAGRHNEKLFFQNSLLSTLIEAIEPFMEPTVAPRLEAFLSDPAGEIKSAIARDAEREAVAGLAGDAPADEREAELLGRLRRFADENAALTGRVATLEAENARLDAALEREEARAAAALDGAPSLVYSNGTGPGNSVAAGAPDTAALDALRREAALLRAQSDGLLLELGAESVEEATAKVRALSDRARDAEAQARAAAEERAALLHALGEDGAGGDPAALAGQLRQTRDALARLENEAGPATLLRDQLSRELGITDAGQILAQVRGLRDRAFALQQQVERMTAERQYLARETGRADTGEVVALLRQLHDNIVAVRTEKATWDADRQLLEQECGTADARQIAAEVRRLRAQVDSLQSVAALLSDMDSALASLGGN
jgi:hypothetical protein